MTLVEALAANKALKTEVAALRENLCAVQFQLAQLQRLVFGSKRERLEIPTEQQPLPFEATGLGSPPVLAPAETVLVPAHPRARPRRAALPEHLPREIEILDLGEQAKLCPHCGRARHLIGEVVSEKLDYVPAALKVLQTRRPKYACRACAGEVGVAPLPPAPLEQGMAAPGLLAHVVVSKFADHLPLHRQEAILRREGIELPRSTLCDWVLAAAECVQPLYARLAKEVRASDLLHSDDTVVPLRAEGATRKARAWSYLDPQRQLAVYEFTETRSGTHPQDWLRNWQGYLIADAYAGYDELYANPAIREVGCWAHARRKFFEVAEAHGHPGLAQEALTQIGTLYHLEQQWQDLAPEARQVRRVEHSAPRLEVFKDWLLAHHPKLLPKSPLAQAMGYVLNQWSALTRFLEDGRLPLDNNAVERALRPVALGRKNWLFAGSVRGGQAAAIHLSFIESAKLHHHNPFLYLKDLFTRLPGAKARDLDALLPHRWQPP